ncbi:hypothetical protein L596_026799 [Steinernema carpocapsae]|uniref:Uncharacterized protein n=1 Tax=Steinernema carpocapsae TaxID=34508 RepID=A0A4U5M2H0_STECR|nr:hypothetical protein L596_026799 [Steinernema carpocapsae]
MSSQRFAGKAVIVTGSTSGIGQAIALLLANQGASITIHGRSLDEVTSTVQLFREKGVGDDRLVEVLGDIKQPHVRRKLIDQTVAHFGKLDVLINNAGTIANQHFDADERFDHCFNVNVKSVMRLTELAVPHLEKTKGNIVNIGSVTAIRRVPVMSTAYAMSKISLEQYMKYEAPGLAKKGIRINTLHPGLVKTSIYTRHGMSEEEYTKMTDEWATHCPMGRSGTPDEMANCVLFLASDEASYVTGAALVCDGGLVHAAE